MFICINIDILFTYMHASPFSLRSSSGRRRYSVALQSRLRFLSRDTQTGNARLLWLCTVHVTIMHQCAVYRVIYSHAQRCTYNKRIMHVYGYICEFIKGSTLACTSYVCLIKSSTCNTMLHLHGWNQASVFNYTDVGRYHARVLQGHKTHLAYHRIVLCTILIHFGTRIRLHERTYNIVTYYVPVSFRRSLYVWSIYETHSTNYTMKRICHFAN